MGKFALEVHVPTVVVETLCMIGAVVTAFAVFCTLDRLMHDRCMEAYVPAVLQDEADVEEEQD